MHLHHSRVLLGEKVNGWLTPFLLTVNPQPPGQQSPVIALGILDDFLEPLTTQLVGFFDGEEHWLNVFVRKPF